MPFERSLSASALPTRSAISTRRQRGQNRRRRLDRRMRRGRRFCPPYASACRIKWCSVGLIRRRQIMKTRALLSLIAVVLAVSGVDQASAQVYPSRPITMVVPLAAGGPLDTIARILSEPMRISLGQPVIVENVTGAAGTIGTGRVARATPDGYTFGMGFLGTLVLNGAIYSLPYDVVKDFDPIALISSNPHVIVVKAGLPAKNLREFIAWLKLNADKASAGTAGAGTTTHLGGLLFQQSAGVRFQLIPYRGAAPALQDVMAGPIEFLARCGARLRPYLPGRH